MDSYASAVPLFRGNNWMNVIDRLIWRFDLKRWKRLTVWIFVLGFSLSLTMTTGCDDPVDVDPDGCSPSLATNLIITNPLAPAPGDTTTLTIQATGEGCGNWANYTWTADGGELLQEKGISVTWVAPMEYGAYRIDCRATLSGTSPDTSRALIMIRDLEYIDTGKIATIRPDIILNTLYFIAEDGAYSPRDNRFLGWSVYKVFGSSSITKVTNTNDEGGGFDFDFTAAERSAIFGSFFTTYYGGLRQQRMNVWKFPTLFGTNQNISADYGGLGFFRKNQHRYPNSNANGNKAVWKYSFAGRSGDGTEDLFNIAFWDELDGPGGWYTVTQSRDSTIGIVGTDTFAVYRYFENIKPMFTPDENNILYFVDTTGAFEPCLIPMVDGAPDTLQRRALMVDEKTGIFEAAGVMDVKESTVFQWRPSSNMLGFISGGEIAVFDYTTETVLVVDELSGVTEFVFSPDGSQLAAVSEDGVYLVSDAGVDPDPVFFKERATDDIVGINWSDDIDEPLLVFRLIRKGKSEVDSWSALVVVELNSGLWSYGTPTIPWHSSREPSGIDYRWMRSIFDEEGTGIYTPFPVLDDFNYPGKDIILIYSHE
jgi:hypothetical protein